MKAFYRLCFLILFGFLLTVGTVNVMLTRNESHGYRGHRVEIERAASIIEQNGLDRLRLADYPALIRVVPADAQDDASFFAETDEDYAIRIINGITYRFDYRISDDEQRKHTLFMVNISFFLIACFIGGMLWFIRTYLLIPFYRLRDLPYDLAKGNLSSPLPEYKNRYFNRFTWGMDLLREQLEYQKEAQLRLQKEKKTLILSITHDIKTPLSAIKLYAKALSEHLYEDADQQVLAARRIEARADDIEAYISQIVTASKEDFLHLETHNTEFYLSAAIQAIQRYYGDKLDDLKIPLVIEPYPDCLVYGDESRCIEVFQNIMENAIKYGEGSEIRITFHEEEDHRLIRFHNAHCTLKEHELPHIFDSFWRGANAAAIKGSGLGLYICRELLHQMEGDIYAVKNDECFAVTVVLRKA